MPILNPTPINQVPIAERKAKQIIQSTARTSERLIREWSRGIDMLWDSEDPQAILDAMGTDAAEVFQLSSATIALMQAVLQEDYPEKWTQVSEKIAKIQPHTIHDDGTITINEV